MGRTIILATLLLASGLRVGADEADAIAACNLAMLNDFDGMSQEEMMACAEKLESPLRRLEEETKAKEAAEREAAEKAKAEAEITAAAAAAEAAKRKQAEDAAAAALLRQKKEQQAMVGTLESDLKMCKTQMANAVAKANGLAECKNSLAEYRMHYVAVDRRLRPFLGNYNVEVVLLPIITLASVIFWLIGCFIGKARVTPMINPSAGTNGVAISEVIIRPGNEVCVIKNRTFNDVDLTGCSLRVAEHVFHFDDGYNLAKGTSVEVHAGPDAKDIKKLSVADHDKFDSRRCNRLFWTAASVFLGSGETTATLLDANDHAICRSS